MDDDIEGKQLLVPSIFMVDCERDTLVTQDKPLWEQKHHGFTFNDSDEAFLERRSRSLHNYALQYPLQSTPECMSPGRHWNGHRLIKVN